MDKIISKIRAILSGTRGESLMEGIASILVFTVLMAAVTMMIMISLRITGKSTADADARQKEANAALAGQAAQVVRDTVEFIVDGDELEVIEIKVSVYSTDNHTAFEPQLTPAGP